MKRKRAFTLVELFVVFAAVILLASVLVPVLRESRSAARIASCKSNQKKVSRAIFAYTEDHDGQLPYNLDTRPWYYDYYAPNLDWPIRVGAVPDEQTPYNMVDDPEQRRICSEGYIVHNCDDRTEGSFKCPAAFDQIEPKTPLIWDDGGYSGTIGYWSCAFSINSGLSGWFDWEEEEAGEVECTRIGDVRFKAVLIGDGNVRTVGYPLGVRSTYRIDSEGKLFQLGGGSRPYDFGPWTHQEHANPWNPSGHAIDFYGHTKEKAILTYAGGHTKAVKDIVHEQWQITDP